MRAPWRAAAHGVQLPPLVSHRPRARCASCRLVAAGHRSTPDCAAALARFAVTSVLVAGFFVRRLVLCMAPVSFFWPAQALRTLANFSRRFEMAEFESLNDALIGAVKALGGSKQVGPLLWPEKTPDAAQRLLLDCLNSDRPAHLTPDQVLFVLRLARRRGYHAAFDWLVDDLGYLPTAPRKAQDEADDLQRQFVAGVAALQELAGRLQAVQGAAQPSVGGVQRVPADEWAPGAFGVGARGRAVGGL